MTYKICKKQYMVLKNRNKMNDEQIIEYINKRLGGSKKVTIINAIVVE